MLALNLNELPRRQESPLQDTLISPPQHDDALNGVKNQLRRLAGSSKSPLQPPPFSRSKSTTICANSNIMPVDPSTQTKESSPEEEPSERLTNFQQRYLYYRSLSQPHLVASSSKDPQRSPPKMTSTPSFLAPTLPPKTSKWSISPKTELHPVRSMLKKSLSTGSISVDTSGWDFPGIARRESPEQNNNIFLAAKKNILTSTDFPIYMSPPPLSTKSGHTPLPTSPKKKPKAKKGLSTPPTSPPPPRFQSFRTALRTSPSYRLAEPLRTGRPRANTADGDVSSPRGRGRHLLKRRHVSASALLPGFSTTSPPPQVKSPRGGDKPLKSKPSKTETKKKKMTKSTKTKKHSHRRDEEEPRRRHKKKLRQKEISTQFDEEEISLPCRSPVDQELGQLLRTVERSKRKLSKDRLHDFEELLKVLSSYQHNLDL